MVIIGMMQQMANYRSLSLSSSGVVIFTRSDHVLTNGGMTEKPLKTYTQISVIRISTNFH